jgi:hypothetical protein
MAGYTRQSSYSNGDVITAAHSNNEFNALLAAFVNTTGHKHDGTAAEGPVIGLIGDPGETTPLNKVVIDNPNNQIEFSVDVSSSSVEQLVIKDGVVEPTTDNDIDLGSSSKQFKDLHIHGTANIDSLVADTANIDGGSIDGATLGTNSVITQAVIDNINIDGATIGHTSDTDLMTLASGILTVAGEVSMTTLDIGGTNVTATPVELNLMDGGTSAGTTAVAGGDGIVTNDGGTMRQTTVDTFDTYLAATTKTLTNKTLDADNNTVSNLEVDNLKSGVLDTDLSSVAATDTTLASAKAIKTYVDAQITAQDLDFQADSGGALAIDLDSETMTFTGGTGIDTSGSGNAVTFAIDSTVATLSGSQTLTNKSIDASQLTGTVANARLDAELQALAGLTSAADKGIQFTGSGSAATYDLTAAGKALLDDANAAAQRTTLGLAIGSDVQAYDAELAALAGLTSAADKGIQFTGSGTAATYDLTAAGKALLDDADASAQRTTMGVAIGSDVQAYDAGLASIAGLTTAANKVIYTTGSDTYAVADFTAFGRSLVDDADAAAGRTTLGLGTAATSASTDFDAAGQSVVMAIALG